MQMKRVLIIFMCLMIGLTGISAAAEEMKMINAYIGENILTIKPEENSSADALIEMLQHGDLTVEMHDYGHFEKVGSIGADLPRNDMQITTGPGDVILRTEFLREKSCMSDSGSGNAEPSGFCVSTHWTAA